MDKQEQYIDKEQAEFIFNVLTTQWATGDHDSVREFIRGAFNPQWAETMIMI